MQLAFTALGDEDEGLPAMAPFAMRQEGKVFNRSETRGSGVVETLPSQKQPQVYTAPPEPVAAREAPRAPEPTHRLEYPSPTQTPLPKLEMPRNPTWLLYALLLANGLTLVLCIVIATRRR
jgi:hypothetical protein